MKRVSILAGLLTCLAHPAFGLDYVCWVSFSDSPAMKYEVSRVTLGDDVHVNRTLQAMAVMVGK